MIAEGKLVRIIADRNANDYANSLAPHGLKIGDVGEIIRCEDPDYESYPYTVLFIGGGDWVRCKMGMEEVEEIND